MNDLEKMQKRIVDFRDAREWKQFHNPKDMALSLTLEATEVLEHFQWKNSVEVERHISKHKDDIGEELADVLYWVLLMANDLGVDLVKTFEAKMQKNEEKYSVEKAKGDN